MYKFVRLILTQFRVTVKNIERLSVSLNESMDQASQQLGTLAKDFSTTKLGMCQYNKSSISIDLIILTKVKTNTTRQFYNGFHL